MTKTPKRKYIIQTLDISLYHLSFIFCAKESRRIFSKFNLLVFSFLNIRSEGSDAFVGDDTTSVVSEDCNLVQVTTKMEAEKKGPGKKRSSRKKDEVRDLESKMFAKFEEQDNQFSSLSSQIGKLFDMLSKRSYEPDSGASGSLSDRVTVEAFSAARRPTCSTSANVQEQEISDVEDILSVHVSDMEKENSGFLFSAQGSEHSGSDEVSCFNRSVVEVDVHISADQERFQRYRANTIKKDKPCTEGGEKSLTLSNALSDKLGKMLMLLESEIRLV